MSRIAESSSHRRPLRRCHAQFALSMVAYVGLLAAVLPWLESHPTSPWRFAVGVTPMIPMLVGALAVTRMILSLDERFRLIQLQALSMAFVISAAGIVTYGFLQEAGLPRPSAWWVWTWMGLIWFASSIYARWRNR